MTDQLEERIRAGLRRRLDSEAVEPPSDETIRRVARQRRLRQRLMVSAVSLGAVGLAVFTAVTVTNSSHPLSANDPPQRVMGLEVGAVDGQRTIDTEILKPARGNELRVEVTDGLEAIAFATRDFPDSPSATLLSLSSHRLLVVVSPDTILGLRYLGQPPISGSGGGIGVAVFQISDSASGNLPLVLDDTAHTPIVDLRGQSRAVPSTTIDESTVAASR